MDNTWRSLTGTVRAADAPIRAPAIFNLGLSPRVFQVLWSLLEGGVVLALGAMLLSLATSLDLITVNDLRLGLCLAAGPAYIILAWLLGRYARNPHPGDVPVPVLTVPVIPQVAAALFACLLAVVLAQGGGVATAVWVGVWFALATGALILAHRVEGAVAPKAIARRWRVRPAVIVGANPAALQLVKDMAGCMDHEVEILGLFDDRTSRTATLPRHLPYLGGLDALVDFVADHEEIDVFMAMPRTAGTRISALLERLRFLPITVWLVPDPELSALALPQLGLQSGSSGPGIRMPTLMTPPFSAWGRLVKTSFDYTAGLAILLLILPILLAISLAIKLDSPGPIFSRQQRSGQFGRTFSIYTFRSAHVADAGAATRMGHYIRKYSIDELPRILNVLRGEMSLVGPRPHAPKAKADGRPYTDVMPDYALRHRVKPGMTGWAQINGWRAETDTEEKLRTRVELDFDYIKNWSFALDMVILLRTIPAMLKDASVQPRALQPRPQRPVRQPTASGRAASRRRDGAGHR
ncbi:exopolysaccharide biosynthesis polyprenyl glycosylphosphotransferase [Nitrospirillum sp. BR 11163]|uniref:exopolysaccharide biosynthesis polyprenyl glycosylphosphotransferase n=1 Tax=Nitrospirillum sp. BR 11163 TaxID=3104323 RepID=UPI002B0015C5|nr:exopolysaccharide biosynthesis polyprenyl glycosylphosphotransferase [Nitrospirillum sp. BR 11163]MEA1673378.1 exopolysaccharide biosynthesis polyprenyl glycosylphosphotransferase [Nitrospirillum sp. BR 11163]